MYPHGRSLVTKHAGKPFAILGVNSDKDRDELKKVLEKERITWRSFCDGGMNGPIARRWNVQSWPTVYVLDHRGVIRGKGLRGVALERLVDEIVKEAGAGR
jgi:hypothetical protein